jgi:hypothetical protein
MLDSLPDGARGASRTPREAGRLPPGHPETMDICVTASCHGRRVSPNVGRTCALPRLVHPTAKPPTLSRSAPIAVRRISCARRKPAGHRFRLAWEAGHPGVASVTSGFAPGVRGGPAQRGAPVRMQGLREDRFRRRHRAREVGGRSKFQTARSAECARPLRCGAEFEEEPAFSRCRPGMGRLSPSSQSRFTRPCRITPTRPWVTGRQLREWPRMRSPSPTSAGHVGGCTSTTPCPTHASGTGRAGLDPWALSGWRARGEDSS